MSTFKNKQPDIRLTYKTVDGTDLPLDVYFPEGSIANAKTIIAIHGGGWTDAMTADCKWQGGWMGNTAKYFAEKGFIAIAFSYRSLNVSEKMHVGDILDDCTDALRFIYKHFNFVDKENVIYIGDSAGGYITTMLGISDDELLRPKITVSCNPVLDTTREKWAYGFKGVNASDYSPFEREIKNSSEFIFLHGTSDVIVEIEDTEKLHNILLENGYKSTFVKIPDAQHAFILFDYKYEDSYVCEITDKIINLLSTKGN